MTGKSYREIQDALSKAMNEPCGYPQGKFRREIALVKEWFNNWEAKGFTNEEAIDAYHKAMQRAYGLEANMLYDIEEYII
ncbi:MAG: hypothetical protein PHW45_04155 [Candidatus ainarchaeum sp.]|nr:hypothetical protein [Candidatus ainarchaeum sp.]